MKFVKLVECLSLNIDFFSSHFSSSGFFLFLLLLCFQMFALTASILEDDKPSQGNEILTTNWIIRCISQIALTLITEYLFPTAFISRYEWISPSTTVLPLKTWQCCVVMHYALHLRHDGCWVTCSHRSEKLQQPFQFISLLFWVAAHSFSHLFD